MIRYVATAVALKAFSTGSLMRRLYRKTGNRFGGQRRSSGPMPGYYADRVKRMLRLSRQHQLIRNGDRIIELGTGWLHWEAITLRLFYDIQAVLFDVWDNRQMGGLKNYVRQLDGMLDDGFGLSPAELERAHGIIRKILAVESFEELYKLLDFEYVIESSGSLDAFKDTSFQLVVSAGVLEHVGREATPALFRATRRVLKPGGWAVHSIDTSDHLAHYDTSVNRKKYLEFSEGIWKALFQNEVQYINRLQRGEWLELARSNGFDLVEEERGKVDISGLTPAERYRKMEPSDLECTVLRLTLRKRA